ncbi:E3 ubiquitin-protein ligase RNF181 isoform X3 [Copidosoma floridanum]|uniref:E3 ubiquitin-protein ligase RNF181 isoform X3 n=1 Tax=Copidosoma floridanum TaxID=29053 RepID=UPI0006C9C2BC|nr:E3 ubiquitin-protein ligase RNF181 isoform X3 [Copidosoma floridanum]
MAQILYTTTRILSCQSITPATSSDQPCRTVYIYTYINNLASTYHSSAQLREQQLQSLNLEINHGIGIAVGLSTGGGSSISDEEQQVRIAKRLGLIQHLPTGLFDGAKKGECVICMMELTSGEEVRYLPCMHTYHTACIDDWLLRSLTCPTCMEPVDAALINSYHPTT